MGYRAGGYVMYDVETQRYWLPAENALVLADENSLVYSVGAFSSFDRNEGHPCYSSL